MARFVCTNLQLFSLQAGYQDFFTSALIRSNYCNGFDEATVYALCARSKLHDHIALTLRLMPYSTKVTKDTKIWKTCGKNTKKRAPINFTVHSFFLPRYPVLNQITGREFIDHSWNYLALAIKKVCPFEPSKWEVTVKWSLYHNCLVDFGNGEILSTFLPSKITEYNRCSI